jgi:hypothetical protein
VAFNYLNYMMTHTDALTGRIGPWPAEFLDQPNWAGRT